jgi:predicted phosphoribosyltransferase/dienelactone hydrolase
VVKLPFEDRADAARQLARALARFRGSRPLVLAVPRGAVPMARDIAEALDGDLDVVLVRKLGAPGHAELAVGAVDESGWRYVADFAASVGADNGYLERAARLELATMRERRVRWTPHRAPLDPHDRTVIVVDDGLATGATMIAALHAVRAKHPRWLVCAVPVAAPDSLERVRRGADEIVCLAAPAQFSAVGQFYRDFGQVEDDDVAAMLRRPVAARDPAAPTSLRLGVGDVTVGADLTLPPVPHGLIVFAHGSGSSRLSPRNRHVAQALNARGYATMLLDLLTPEEDAAPDARFDIALLGRRLLAAVEAAGRMPECAGLPIGLFGASTGAAAALIVAAGAGAHIAAVVLRGGRPDLAGADVLATVRTPTLLVVGGADHGVIELNEAALARLGGEKALAVVPGATHLFEEPDALDRVGELAADWFARWL